MLLHIKFPISNANKTRRQSPYQQHVYTKKHMLVTLMNQRLRRDFSQDCHINGLNQAANQFLQRIHLDLETNATPIANSSTLIISNHINPLDLFVLTALAPNQSYLITLKMNDLGPAFNRFVLPVYISRTRHTSKRALAANSVWIIKEGWMSRDRARQLNQATITQAAQRLNQGQNVVMFPQGIGFDHQRPWQTGIGHLINQITNSDIKVQFVHITGLTTFDAFRALIPTLVLPLLPYYKFNVSISSPICLNQLVQTSDPKAITGELFSKYQNTFDHTKP